MVFLNNVAGFSAFYKVDETFSKVIKYVLHNLRILSFFIK